MRKAQRMRVAVPLRDYCSNFLYNITHTEGAARCAAGTAVAIRDFRYGRNDVVSYRVTESARASNSEESMPMITDGELQANVLRSRTARLPEWDTKGRDSKFARELAKDPKQPVEDFVELAQNKIKMWPIVPLLNPQHVEWAGQA